ncbi:MAG: hypothetical protein HRU29_10575 [Rhizobiales bacterium]|nr:hypothetical protein [Hyphomicrobiales bacterium]NRB14836.1 hypothetical protein [Hyphomicrobiales bacterium]
MNSPLGQKPKLNNHHLIAILGGVLILASVVFMSSTEDLLPKDANIQAWYIGAVITTLSGWVLLFVGILGARKKLLEK